MKLKKWFKTFQKYLSNWIDQASPTEWLKLEAQDASGKLKKLSFERLIKFFMRKLHKKIILL